MANVKVFRNHSKIAASLSLCMLLVWVAAPEAPAEGAPTVAYQKAVKSIFIGFESDQKDHVAAVKQMPVHTASSLTTILSARVASPRHFLRVKRFTRDFIYVWVSIHAP
jgi:hypothetical protein